MNPEITRVIESTDVGDTGKTFQSIRVEFKVGTHGPFTVTVPKADFTAAAVNALIQKFVSQLGALQGVK